MKRFIYVFISALVLMGCKSSFNAPLAKNAMASKSQLENVATSFSKKAPKEQDFIWGMNGHPMTSPGYKGEENLDLQINALKQLQTPFYRINFRSTADGDVAVYKGNAELWGQLMIRFQTENIKVLPVFQLDDYDKTLTPQAAYAAARKKAKGFASRFGDYFEFYEIGNERDFLVLKEGADGDLESDYNLDDFEVLAAYLDGLNAGVKEADPEAKTIVNCTGWKRWGYFDYLKKQDVQFDIIGWHWYSNQGTLEKPFNIHTTGEDVLQLLKDRFNKPIWITEINQHKGTFIHGEDLASLWLKRFIEEIERRPYVKALFFYELFDQPHLHDKKRYENPKEAYYGLAKPNENSNALLYKSVAETLKFKVEESHFGSQHFLNALFKKVRGENPSSLELEHWSKTLDKSANVDTFIETFSSSVAIDNLIDTTIENEVLIDENEKQIHFIKEKYTRILSLKTNEDDETYWSKEMKKGKSKIDVIKSLLISRTFYNQAIIKGYEERTGFSFYNN